MIAEKIYAVPQSIEEALKLAKKHKKSFRYLAGGTDVVVNKFQGNETSDCLIDLTALTELREIVRVDNNLLIGSLVKLDALQDIEVINNHFPALVKAAGEVASPMLRKTATLGGNILCENRCSFYNQSEWWREAIGYCLKCEGDVCIATGGKKACFSKFVSDTAPVLISMGALLDVADTDGNQIMTLESIYTGDGIAPRNLSPTAIIRYIILPLDKEFITVFKKLRPREAVDFTSLTTAVTADNTGKLRIVIGGVDPKPVLVDVVVKGDYAAYIKEAVRKCRVVDNDFYSRPYRRDMIKVFLEQSFDSLIK